MKQDGAWYIVETGKHKLPRWQRSAWRSADGVVYLPAAITGRSQNEVFLCASYDGTSAVVSGKHLYFPAEWLAAEFPACRETCHLVIERLDQLAAH